MTSTTFVYRATTGLLWALVLWHSWTCRGLFVDGSAFVVQIVRREWFFDFYPPRLFAMILGQIPMMTAVRLGVTDLHWLAVLLSLGLFGLPTLIYQLALRRAKEDPVLLATVVAAIGVVFMTTSFFIVGEYNSAYAIALLTAVHLATLRRLRTSEALFMVAVGFLSIRTYEVMIYFGPLLAAMVVWTLWRLPSRPLVPTVLYLVVAVCFLLGMAVAIDSVVHPHSASHLQETYRTVTNFWQNMQFDLAFGAALVVVAWGLIKPTDLALPRPYVWASVILAILALSPMLAVGDSLVRPLAKSQYVARTAAGLVIVGMVVFIWAYSSDLRPKLKVLATLGTPVAARRFLAFACLILAATLPSDLFLTQTWVAYLDALRETVRSRGGLIAFEDTPLARRPYSLFVENWVLSSQSLAVRSKVGDGIIVPPKDFDDWLPFSPLEPPNMGRYTWRD